MNQTLSVILTALVISSMGAVGWYSIINFFPQPEEVNKSVNVTVIIDTGDGEAYSFFIHIEKNTVYEALKVAAGPEYANLTIEIDEQYLPDVLIHRIGSYSSGDNGYYWLYYVNGEPGTSACNEYYLSENDIVEWRYTSF